MTTSMDWNLFFQAIIALGVVCSGIWVVLWLCISPLKEILGKIDKKVTYIHEFLLRKFEDYIPLSESKSQKKITNKCREILKNHNINTFLKEKCNLLKDNELKEKEAAQIFMESWNWVEKYGIEKVFEIILNTNYSKESIKELLALSIMEKIIKS